ncbi:hypothetical protein D3C73_1351150 [compost metagenome]
MYILELRDNSFDNRRNSSSDNTLERVRPLGKVNHVWILCVENQANSGFAQALN